MIETGVSKTQSAIRDTKDLMMDFLNDLVDNFTGTIAPLEPIGGTVQRSQEDPAILRVPTGQTSDDHLVSVLQRRSRHSTARQLRGASPFDPPANAIFVLQLHE
jgi:hypothetical protein